MATRKIGEATIDTDGYARLNYTVQETGDFTVIAQYDEFSVSQIIINRNYNLSVTQTSSSLRKGETNTIRATLTNNGQPVSGAQVNFVFTHNGSVVQTGTSTTNSSGVGTCEYECEGIGDIICTVTTTGLTETKSFRDKDTYNISINTNKNTYYDDELITVTGSISNGTEPISGIVLTRRINSSTVTTVTTNANGQFTDTFTLSSGTAIIDYTYQNLDYSNSKTITVQPSTYDLDLTSTTPIIQTGDNATVLATLTKNGTPATNKALTYQVKHGNTTVDQGSTTTDSNGQARITYTGTGDGNTTFNVGYDSISETYTIKDYIIYDPLRSDSGHWTWPSAVDPYYDEDEGVMLYSEVAGDQRIPNDITLPSNNFKVSFTLYGDESNDLRYCTLGGWSIANSKVSSTNKFCLFYSWPPEYSTNNSYTANTDINFEATYSNGTLTCKKNGSTIMTKSISLRDNLFQLYIAHTAVEYVKDLKIEKI